jgi:hypothetical protein
MELSRLMNSSVRHVNKLCVRNDIQISFAKPTVLLDLFTAVLCLYRRLWSYTGFRDGHFMKCGVATIWYSSYPLLHLGARLCCSPTVTAAFRVRLSTNFPLRIRTADTTEWTIRQQSWAFTLFPDHHSICASYTGPYYLHAMAVLLDTSQDGFSLSNSVQTLEPLRDCGGSHCYSTQCHLYELRLSGRIATWRSLRIHFKRPVVPISWPVEDMLMVPRFSGGRTTR